LNKCRQLIDRVAEQTDAIGRAADLCAETILAGRMVHLFGSGHSRILVEEMWPRYGSFPGFNPIVELSVSFHNLVIGANGQRQAMFLENVSGLAEQILRNFDLSPIDCAIVVSSSGCNRLPIEMAEGFRNKGVHVIALISKEHSEPSTSRDPRGVKLQDFAEIILDTGAPLGDAMINIPGLDYPVSPASTVGGCMLVNALKAEIASRLTASGMLLNVLTASAIVGATLSEKLFQDAYDEHAHRLARLYEHVGEAP
jgi:uncharacterized phosphosugar-binding protein